MEENSTLPPTVPSTDVPPTDVPPTQSVPPTDVPPTGTGTEAPTGAPARAGPSLRTRWAVAICTVAALAFMVVVVVLAGQDEGADDDTGRTARVGTTDLYGGAQPPVARNESSACGTVDLSKPPVLEFLVDGGEMDLGSLKQGVKLTRSVEFRNAGEGPLCVYEVKTGCGCLKATLAEKEKQRYEPGEKGSIELKIDTAGRQGLIRKPVSVLSNDPRNPRSSFRTKLDVNAGLMADRRFVDFGSAAPGIAVTRDLLLRSPKSDAPWKVLSVVSARKMPGREPTAYTFVVAPITDPRFRRVRLSITHPGLAKVGTFQDSILVKTSHAERPELMVPARINIVPRILSRSRVISLGYVRSGRGRPPTRARIQPGAPGVVFDITRVEILPPDGETAAGGPGFSATFGSDTRGWWVDVKYDGKNRKAGLLEAQLVVHTTDKEQPELRIPVRATIRAPRKP